MVQLCLEISGKGADAIVKRIFEYLFENQFWYLLQHLLKISLKKNSGQKVSLILFKDKQLENHKLTRGFKFCYSRKINKIAKILPRVYINY